MATRVSMVVLLASLILLTVKYWGLQARQDACLLTLDTSLRQARAIEEEKDEEKEKAEMKLTEKELEIGTMKKEKKKDEITLRVCEKENQSLQKDLERNAKEYQKALKEANKDLSDMIEKYSKMKKEYERSLASEMKLREDKTSLSDAIEDAKKLSEKNMNKLKKENVALEETNEANMLKLEELIKETKKEEKGANEGKLLKGGIEQPKRNIIEPNRDTLDEKVEEAFAKINKKNKVQPKHDTLDEHKLHMHNKTSNGNQIVKEDSKNVVGDNNDFPPQVQRPADNMAAGNETVVNERNKDKDDDEEDEEGGQNKNGALEAPIVDENDAHEKSKNNENKL